MKKTLVVLIASLVICSPCLAAEDAFKKYSGRSVNIFWTDNPPVLDGKRDDACWKNAEIAGNFRTFQKAAEEPTQQTEVRLCYDADNLYVFYILHEKNMKKLAYGPAEDMRDMLNFSGDVAELFLDPDCTRARKYQFCASPLGTRYDGGPGLGRKYNPEWKVKTGIYKDRWTVEMAIPFKALALDGEFYGTPQKGEKWGIEFCRDQARLHEWSQWAPTRMGFHEVKNYGTAIFMGRRKGPSLPVVTRVNKEELFFGPGSFEFGVKGYAGDAQCRYKLTCDNIQVEVKKIPVNEKVDIPRRISKGGQWAFTVSMEQAGKRFYVGYTTRELPMIVKLLDDIEKNIRQGEIRIKNFAHPEAGVLKTRLAGLKEKSRKPLAIIKNAKKLSSERWKKLLNELGELEKLWKGMEFDLYLVKIYPQDHKNHAFTVGIAGPHEKIYRKTRYSKNLDTPVKLALAGCEYESFQLVVIPFWTNLTSVKLQFTDLIGASAKIPAKNFRYSLVDYVRQDAVAPDHKTMKMYEPDILWPAKPIDVKKGSLQSVYVDLLCPPGTPAGEYAGNVTIENAAGKVTKQIKVLIYGFDLPEVASLENNFWFGPANYNWGRFYGLGFYGKIPYTLDIYKKQAEVIARYRLTPFCDDTLTLCPHLTIYREKDGSFSFDFSKWAEFIKVGLQYGGNSWRASLSCNLGAMYLFNNTKVIDRATGEKKTARQYSKQWNKEYSQGKAYWDTHPIYPQYLKAYIAFLKKMGLMKMAHFEIYDEPNSNPRWLDMIRHHSWLKKFVPELKLTAYGMHPLRNQAGKGCIGLCDVWAPNLSAITPEVLAAMKDRRKKFGEKYWFYTCGEHQDKDNNPSPHTQYDRSYLAPRVLAWHAWQMRVDGMLIYAMSGIPKQNINTKQREKQWPAVEWSDGWARGNGTLIYPGPGFEVIPGMRLTSVRDGMEDYEYFKVLNDLSSKLDPVKQKTLLQQAQRELAIEKDIINGEYSWTRDVEILNSKRARLAALIEQIKKQIE